MNIGIDIDDTLTDLSRIRIQTAKEYFKEMNIMHNLIRTDTHLFSEMFDWNQDECDKFWFEKADDMLLKVKARKNASKVIKALKDNGHKIFIITARTKEWHKDPYKLSYEWLKKNDIPFDELHVGHLNKLQVCLENKIDLFIDDMPKTLRELKENGIDTLLMKNPHNVLTDDLTFVSTWDEIERYVENKTIEKEST